MEDTKNEAPEPQKSEKTTEAVPPVKNPAPEEKDSLASKENMKRKKVQVNGLDYYVVTVDEVQEYKKIKDKYKSDGMSAFILYMHTDFIKDLSSIRRTGNIKKAVKVTFYIIGVIVLLIICLFVYCLSKRYFSS